MNKTMKKIKTQILCFFMALCMVSPITPSMPVYAASVSDAFNGVKNGEYQNNDAGARMFYQDVLCVLGTDGYAGHNPPFSESEFVSVWSQIYGQINHSVSAYSTLNEYPDIESMVLGILKGDTGGDDAPAEDDATLDWILPLIVPEDFSAKNAAGQVAGLSIVICQQFGIGILLVGMMQLMLAMKNDDPGSKERALKALVTGILLTFIYVMMSWMFTAEW